MIEQIFTFLSNSMNQSFGIALFASFCWGILSILLSPCHLSSIPLIIGYISNQKKTNVKHSFYIALTFSIGILITIALIGIITASMGRLIGDIGSWVNLFAAILFLLVGLYLMDVINISWNFFSAAQSPKSGLYGALILGLIFGISLGPCTFAYLAPVLGIVFHLATTSILKAILLIVAFGIGHCAVIVLAGSMTKIVQKYLNWSEDTKTTIYIKRVAGLLLILGSFYFIYLMLNL